MAAPNQLKVTLADGNAIEVQTTLEDRLNFETALRKNKSWGKLEDNSMKLLPYLAWSALRRTGKTELTWQQFTTGDTAALSVDPVTDEDTDDEDEALTVDGVGKDTPTARSTTSLWSSPGITAAPHGAGETNPAHA